jgi:hypothetical protein
MHTLFWLENVKGRDQSQYLGVVGGDNIRMDVNVIDASGSG